VAGAIPPPFLLALCVPVTGWIVRKSALSGKLFHCESLSGTLHPTASFQNADIVDERVFAAPTLLVKQKLTYDPFP